MREDQDLVTLEGELVEEAIEDTHLAGGVDDVLAEDGGSFLLDAREEIRVVADLPQLDEQVEVVLLLVF